jgi:Raf kinase inhibitor-like YbhB/YbcL family protein
LVLVSLVLGAVAERADAAEKGNRMPALQITSNAFESHSDIPARYTCQGKDTSPPLSISGVPDPAESLALIVEDPDAPDPRHPQMVWDHWILYDLSPDTSEIREGSAPAGAKIGKNGWGKAAWGGPCPPKGKHRYFFRLYALDRKLDLPAGVEKERLRAAMEGHILAEAELVGMYEKH